VDDQRVEAESVPIAKWIFGVGAACAAVVAITANNKVPDAVRTTAAFLLLIGMLVEVFLLALFARRGTGSAPIVPLVAGAAFAAGGIAFDVGATVIVSPTFSVEANVYARAFLDSGYPASFIYSFGAAVQGVAAMMACVGWVAFLRHHRTILALAWSLDPRSFRQFCNAAVSGVLHPRPFAFRVSSEYRLTCLLLATYIGGHAYRWLLGLEWLRVVPVRVSLAPLGMFVGLAGYFVWLWWEYRKKT
jgi:hypothetical protein